MELVVDISRFTVQAAGVIPVADLIVDITGIVKAAHILDIIFVR